MVELPRSNCELEINPLLLSPAGADSRGCPCSHRQSPSQIQSQSALQAHGHHALPILLEALQLKDGTKVTLRPLRPEDADMVQAFVRNLSDKPLQPLHVSINNCRNRCWCASPTWLRWKWPWLWSIPLVAKKYWMSRYVYDPDMEVANLPYPSPTNGKDLIIGHHTDAKIVWCGQSTRSISPCVASLNQQ